LLAWSAGLDRTLAATLIEEGALEAPRDFEDAANDNDELRIAARMAGALPLDQIREIIGLARQFAANRAGGLRELSKLCFDHISEEFGRAAPFQQGEAAARFVRERLEIPADQCVQVFEIIAGLGIELRHATAEPPTLDGLAIWGDRYGPGVFLNESSGRILRHEDQKVDTLFLPLKCSRHECLLALSSALNPSPENFCCRPRPLVGIGARLVAQAIALNLMCSSRNWSICF